MVTLFNLQKIVEKGHHVTVIGPSPYHYYSGMGPGMLGGTYRPDEIRFSTRHMVEKSGSVFIEDEVDRVNPDEKTIVLKSEKIVAYDVISFNIGSYVPQTIVSENKGDIFSVKPIERLIDARRRILELVSEKKAKIDIIGGGPASAEIAGNIWLLGITHGGNMPEIRVFSGKTFMDRFHNSIRKKVVRSLSKRGIRILENSLVKEVEAGKITLESGANYRSDLIFLAVGVKPSAVFGESGLPVGPDGGLLVNRYLQSVEYPEIFGGGDCIYFDESPLDKVGVYAVRQNLVLYQNLMASLDETTLKPFEPGGDYLLIFNMGDGTGILRKNWFTLNGKVSFFLKDYIDRKFMKKFQSLE
jgi:NADH dehydrogenase FAD-containing subunit